MKMGQRYLAWQNEEELRTELLKGATVSDLTGHRLYVADTIMCTGKNLQRPQTSPEIIHLEQDHIQHQWKRTSAIPQPRLQQNQYTPPMEGDSNFQNHYEREESRTPPLFAYH